MKMQRTQWWQVVVGIIIGALCGSIVFMIVERGSMSLLGAPWFVDIVLVALGIIVLILAWQVKQYVDGKRPYIDADRAVLALVLAKALILTGAVLFGWYAVQAVLCLPHLDIEYYQELAIQCAIAAVLAGADSVAGYIAQHWCQLPPNKGPEHPQIKAQRRLMTSQQAQANSQADR